MPILRKNDPPPVRPKFVIKKTPPLKNMYVVFQNKIEYQKEIKIIHKQEETNEYSEFPSLLFLALIYIYIYIYIYTTSSL